MCVLKVNVSVTISQSHIYIYIYISKSFAIIPFFVHSDMHLIFYFWGALFGLPKLFLSTYLFRAWAQEIIHHSMENLRLTGDYFQIHRKVHPQD